MRASPPLPLDPPWLQPPGLWRARQASLLLQQLGCSAPISEHEWADAAALDQSGFSCWHYWSYSPQPMTHWEAMQRHAPEGLRDQRALDGTHAWHTLALRGHAQALAAWQARFGAPEDISPTLGGDSVLHRAVWSGCSETVRAVLPYQEEWLCAQDEHGLTALILAIHRCPEAIALLLEAGVDPNVCDEQGKTAQHHAASYGDLDTVHLIAAMGGDLGQCDGAGHTPEDVLERRLRIPEPNDQHLRAHWSRKYLGKLWF